MSRILVIDLETTGFLQSGGKIIEVGIVGLNLETGAKKYFSMNCVTKDQLHEKKSKILGLLKIPQ